MTSDETENMGDSQKESQEESQLKSAAKSAAGPDGEDSRYVDLFVDSKDSVNWSRLAEDDPEAKEELEALEEIDKIRTAYLDAAPSDSKLIEADLDAGIEAGIDSILRKQSSSTDVEVPTRFGHYKVLESIGEGGFATIYKAYDESTDRKVALKILSSRRKDMSEELIKRFLREAKALANLRHKNIVQIHHVIESEEHLGLCMELISGRSLGEIIKDKSSDPGDLDTAEIAAELSSALAEVHRAGFIHRDIKAENVMIDSSGRVVLMDFGISRSVDQSTKVTATGVLVGTPIAMSPEQYEFRDIDERTDIYALGCLLYHQITGRHPISGRSMEEIRGNVIDANYPRIRELRQEVPRELEGLILKAMHPDPKRRFQNATEMEQAFRKLVKGDVEQESQPVAKIPTYVIVLLVGILASLMGILGVLLVNWD